MTSVRNESDISQGPTLSQCPDGMRGSHTEAQWENHQSMIKTLYIDERRTLQEVMDIMRKDFSFDASPKVYKKRLRAWGFKKNIKLGQGEASSFLQAIRSNSPHLDQTTMQQGCNVRLANGQVVPQRRLATHLRRREGRTSDKNPLTIRYLRSPRSLHLSEAVLLQVHTYINGQWRDVISTAEQLDTLRGKDEDAWQVAGIPWNSLAYGVRWALQQKKLNDALILMRRAPEALMNMIKRSKVFIFAMICMAVMFFTQTDLLDPPEAEQLLTVVKCLVKYAAVSVAHDMKLPGSHPVRRLLVLLADADKHDLHEMAKKAWQVSCQSWYSLIDHPTSNYCISLWIKYGEVMGLDALPRDLGNVIALNMKQNASQYGQYHPLTTRSLQMQTMYLTYKDEADGRSPYFNKEIAKLSEDLLERGPEGLLKADALSWLAKACRARGERDSAERYMRDMINFLLQDDTYRNSLARGFMNDLETWLIEWGQSEKAAEIATWRTEKLGAEVTA